MPFNEEQEIALLDFLHNAIPVCISKEKESIAKKEYEEYKLNNNFKKIEELNPHTIYLIISELKGDEQADFIRNNIDVISKNDEEIFIYNMMYPHSLSYYLNFKSLHTIKTLDKCLFAKILNSCVENLIEGFSNEEIMSFFREFKYDIKENMKEHSFVNFYLYSKQKIYNNFSSGFKETWKEWHNISTLAKKECMKLTTILIDDFNDTISKLNDHYFLNFYSNALDVDESDSLNNFFVLSKERMKSIYKTIDHNLLFSSFEDVPVSLHRKIFEHFGDIILKRGDLKEYFVVIDSDLLCEYYKKDKSYFDNIDVEDWLKIPYLNENLKYILNDYVGCDFEKIFNSNRSSNREGIIYLENLYRNSIKDETFSNLEEINSIYSNEYIKNLEIIKRKMYRKELNRRSDIYIQHFKLFVDHLLKYNHINEVTQENIYELERYFFQIIKGLSLINVRKIESINNIALYNRVGKNYSVNENEFSLEQIKKFNVKEHKLLLENIEMNGQRESTYRTLVLKLMLLVGFERAKYILSLDKKLTTLEHLVGNVDVKNIKMDDYGDPILNEKIINLLFKDLHRNRIETMLNDKTNDLYKYFPRIFNEWDLIELNKNNKNLKNIIEFLKSDDVCVSAKYYRLKGLFKYIGCNNDIVKETLTLHDEILKRNDSSIPRIKGRYGEYTYEVLKLKDMEGLTIGNRTDCCFTVKGNAYSSLKHALTNKDGRILVVKKNGELIAHSWLWRNGNVLCLDNIEVSKSINEIDFLDVYLKFADEIVEKSARYEQNETCIKNVVIGRAHFDKKIKGLEKYKTYVSDLNGEFGNNIFKVNKLPFVVGDNLYSDAKTKQVLIKGNGDFNYYDTDAYYSDDRNKVLIYSNMNKENSETIENIINGLRYIKLESEDKIACFELIDLDNYEYVSCNEEWYITIDEKGNIERYIHSNDDRAFKEFEKVYNEQVNKLNIVQTNKR